jgi:2-alkenal reductase
VVNIRVARRSEGDFRFQPEQGSPPDELVRGQGSGFVIDSEGHIVTNHHVVEGAEEVLVIFSDGDQAQARVVGSDPDSDLAVIKVGHLPSPDIVPLELGDSDQVKAGQIAIAIGNPFGLQGTLTTGIVSAIGRTLPLGRQSAAVGGRFSIPRMLQTDAAINPGNSGGPLLDSRGRVIGVNTAINAREGVSSGVGFAVPVNLIRRIVPQLIREGRYAYPWLGISGRDVNSDIVEAMKLPERRGALIVEVIKGSPAERAGLRGSDRAVTVHDGVLDIGGDVVTAVDGVPVRQFDDLLVYLIEKTSVGQRISLTILRDGRSQSVEVQLVERPRD